MNISDINVLFIYSKFSINILTHFTLHAKREKYLDIHYRIIKGSEGIYITSYFECKKHFVN